MGLLNKGISAQTVRDGSGGPLVVYLLGCFSVFFVLFCSRNK